jgi:hypothetical protein
MVVFASIAGCSEPTLVAEAVPTPTADTERINDRCLAMFDVGSRGRLFEVMATFDGRSCEALVPAGVCTPGRAPCRSESIDPLEAIARVDLVLSASVDSGTLLEPARIRLVDGNVIAEGAERKQHLVCELRKLAGAELASCRDDPRFESLPIDGWCVSDDPAVLERGCWSSLRIAGGAEPRPGSELFGYIEP